MSGVAHACSLRYSRGRGRRTEVQGYPGKVSIKFYLKNKLKSKVQVADHLPSKYEALGSKLQYHPPCKKKRKKEREGKEKHIINLWA
jgi:hypothetical protein